ncbi:MAG: hydantoinase B/oxoprolinase family protein [Pirellulaceae bacterium]|nr:hydantoinase B/oxoprolinase family protein [Pirellulaceae bacterium]
MTPPCWQFWLDVGGTFTDCLARRPDGVTLRRKVLSSAVTKGAVGAGSSASHIVDPARAEPAGFWSGYRLRVLDDTGRVIGESAVTHSQPGRIAGTSLPPGRAYELVSPEEAPILAIRLFLGLALDQPIPPCDMRLGTTRGTNALLTRRGAKTGLVTTRGLADILHIGYQNRPKLFELAIQKPVPLFSAVAEIDERIAADGTVLQTPRAEQVRAALATLQGAGIESLAICLHNAYANPAHELVVEQIARDLGFAEVSISTRVSPLMKLVPRGDTTVVDAYLNPILRTYIGRLRSSLALPLGEDRGEGPGGNPVERPTTNLRLMTSSGGLASAASFTGKDSVLSGPAGGVVGFSRVAEVAGFPRAIGFDMGGTSTDVSRFDGRFEYEFETEKAGVRIVAPMLAIETVAAGGGSVCKFDGMKLVVGPDSAGADPGPACYGRGGPLTVTDCNFLLGRLLPDHFPFPLDYQAVRRRLDEVASQLATSLSPIALAEGFLRIANANMAQAIRSISIAKGYDPRDYVLVAFGAAGPQHACAVAAELGIRRVLSHPDAGVLCALGMGLADIVKHRSAGVYQRLDAAGLSRARQLLDRLSREANDDVLADGGTAEQIEITRSLDLRYVGTDVPLSIAEPAAGDYAAVFTSEHRRLYGYVYEQRPLEIVAARVAARGRSDAPARRSSSAAAYVPTPDGTRGLVVAGASQTAALYDRERLRPGAVIDGPAILVEPLTTTIVDAGWRGELLGGGELVLTSDAGGNDQEPSTKSQANPNSEIRNPKSAGGSAGASPFLNFSSPSPSSQPPALSSSPDPVQLEVFSNHFTAIATQMGITLRGTSTSVNVKERLDFSCAIFTATGDLVVNAPHIPVHLGAMGETVRRVIADNPAMQPGDVFVTNDPYRGGSHLPDVTVVTPVFHNPVQGSDSSTLNFEPGTLNSQLLFFTASRAHHAEIGGIAPGSMPPFSRTLADEGVLIRNFRAVAGGVSRLEQLRSLLAAGQHPSRSPETNLADITAQMAANQQGANDLTRMIERYSQPVVLAYMRHIQTAAERKMRATLASLPPGRREFTEYLDDGTPIHVAITIVGDEATIDFTGSGPLSPGNLNANRAIVTAAVMYVLRLLIGEEIPLNQGVLAPINLIVPEGILSPPERERPEDCAAVVGGNVETSQRVVDTLLGALGLAAASQGTMNNLLFGDATFGYYETICGGSGATAAADGADAVHTHMTNTRLTDPEVLEARYPVRLVEFSIRRGSGGAGQRRGGDGVVRRIEFLRPLTLSLLTQRRGPFPPFGLAGGESGALGKNTLTRAAGRVEPLAGLAQIEVQPGDIITIETPGGGGWGLITRPNFVPPGGGDGEREGLVASH